MNAYDCHMLRADPFLVRISGNGFLKPKNQRFGVDLAGRVEAVGKNVKQFKPGDEVYGMKRGGFAEYVCSVEDYLALKPANMSFEQAAAVPMAGTTALQDLRDKGQIQPGQKVLIYGASGGVGTFAVQIAKSFSAEVTAVCSTKHMDMVRSIGADHVIDYTKEDFTRNGQQYDLILAANGYHSIFDYARALTPKGIFIVAGGTMTQLFQIILLGPRLSKTGGRKMSTFMAETNQKDLDFIRELLEAGKVVPVMEKCYPLSQASEAVRYVDGGHASGKIVLTVEHNRS